MPAYPTAGGRAGRQLSRTTPPPLPSARPREAPGLRYLRVRDAAVPAAAVGGAVGPAPPLPCPARLSSAHEPVGGLHLRPAAPAQLLLLSDRGHNGTGDARASGSAERWRGAALGRPTEGIRVEPPLSPARRYLPAGPGQALP